LGEYMENIPWYNILRSVRKNGAKRTLRKILLKTVELFWRINQRLGGDLAQIRTGNL
jgi:hypothetical protein